MEKRYITIIIDSITDLNTTNFEIEVSFSVFDDHPDFIELAVESSTQQGISQHDTKLVEMKDDVKSYKGTLKIPIANIVFNIVAHPIIIKPDNERLDKYEDGSYVDNDMNYMPYALVRTTDKNAEFPAPHITEISPFPKTIYGNSGIKITWQTIKKYGEYELLIRKAGEEAYDTILFKATADNSYKLMSRKLNNVAIDFIMSDLHHLHNFEIQIRGVQPATVPLETVSSNWSPVVTFHTAIPLNSLSGFLYNKVLSTGIRKYFPQNTNVSLRRQMWIDDIY
jgi:hypothetical protein